MRDNLALLLALLFLIFGAVLTYDVVSNSGVSGTVRILGASVLLSLGLLSIWIALKNWWKWRRIEKEYLRVPPPPDSNDGYVREQSLCGVVRALRPQSKEVETPNGRFIPSQGAGVSDPRKKVS